MTAKEIAKKYIMNAPKDLAGEYDYRFNGLVEEIEALIEAKMQRACTVQRQICAGKLHQFYESPYDVDSNIFLAIFNAPHPTSEELYTMSDG